MPKKLTLEEIKNKLVKINHNIEILATEYINSKIPLDCHCLICNEYWKMNWNNLSNDHGCPNCYYKSKFISEDEIIKFVNNQGYKFMNFITKGKTIDIRIFIECSDHHIYETSFKAFRDGKRCRKCSSKRIAELKTNNIKKITELIIKNGYTIIGNLNYKNNKSKFTIKCENGHIRETSYNALSKTPDCPKCNGIVCKYSIDDVRDILKELGMELLDDTYLNNHTPIKYRCTCGNITYNTLRAIMNCHKCEKCSKFNKRYSLEEVQSIFYEYGCELLENEINKVSDKLKFKCKCGRIYFKNLFEFLKSPQCAECGYESRSGENSPNWNPNLTDDERKKNRKYKEYECWRLSVYERDNYTCQCCGDNTGGNLNAHHLDSHDWAKDKRLDLSNAVTLCEICHTDFHKIYGYGDNTKEQFEEYMKDIYNNAI